MATQNQRPRKPPPNMLSISTSREGWGYQAGRRLNCQRAGTGVSWPETKKPWRWEIFVINCFFVWCLYHLSFVETWEKGCGDEKQPYVCVFVCQITLSQLYIYVASGNYIIMLFISAPSVYYPVWTRWRRLECEHVMKTIFGPISIGCKRVWTSMESARQNV